MTREVCREMARRGYPVVRMETGSAGEIVYPYIREIKVIYASPEEAARGFPSERLAVVVADRCGHSETECLMRQLRLPTEDEARLCCSKRITRAADIEEMLRTIENLRARETRDD